MTGWQFWVDRGGTFTDIVARDPAGRLHTRKLLSENPGHYVDATIAGIRDLLRLSAGAPIPPDLIDHVKMGTTVATNALLERKGARTLLLVNHGFADLLRIGTQARPRLFDLDIRLPSMLYEQVAEVSGRVAADGNVIEQLDLAEALQTLRRAREGGLETVAIALIHAWKYPEFERQLGAAAADAGFGKISLSHAISPLLGLVPRGDTTVADAYLSPVLRRYIDSVAAGLGGAKLYFMQSHGGLAAPAHFTGKDAILSGPAGGIVGAARTAGRSGLSRIIGFDMGGTSTDVALYDNRFERVFDTEIAGVRLRAPMLAINTVAAGGGSICSFDQGRLRVGPASAGAHPGPAAYRNGGPLTVTDANVAIGKIQPRHFPALFGPQGDAPLDAACVHQQFDALASHVAATMEVRRDGAELAAGFISIAVANMAHAIRQITIQKGRDPADFALACFGGAGGQHACLVADELGMDTVFIHPLAGVLSAYGIGLADLLLIREQAVEQVLSADSVTDCAAIAEKLCQEAVAGLIAQDADPGAIKTMRFLHICYAGTDAALAVPFTDLTEMTANFEAAHLRLFGFVTGEKPLVAQMVSVEAAAPGAAVEEAKIPARDAPLSALETVRIFTDSAWHDAPVFDREALRAEDTIPGPALIRETIATTIVEPGWQASVTRRNHLILKRVQPRPETAVVDAQRPDPVLLELFNNMFMAIAEQCGAVLRNTAQSVNIRERLDFSCAIFDGAGGLVANAPHVPVHLGAMGASVNAVLNARAGSLRPGDAVVLNNPYAGGTHLPDLTLVTPVFDETGAAIRFFVACRAHHADIGGLTPGSTPPFSHRLEEEGVVIDDLLILTDGAFQEAAFRNVLTWARYPARNPDQNIADMKAQIAANATGVAALSALIGRYGWDLVAAYMRHVMDNAEAAIRTVIATLRDGAFHYTMDNGAALKVKITVDHAAREATIDFTGTSPADAGNFNAPPAVTKAAVLYAVRCLVTADIPLNEGCLKPLTIIIPPDTFLSPAPGAAVVAGNTEVSQAVTAALFGAFGACASAQATMNNFLFGDAKRQYYETICGGAGAGPGFAGASAVHTHMTNTRITDPEILELRYPVRLDTFSIRRGSGGKGAFAGGDGAVRKLRFLEPMTATIVASRRTLAPFGLEGGKPGAPGRQWIERADGAIEELPGNAQAELAAGDAFIIETPGGGGFGVA